MAYISTEDMREKRQLIRSAFPAQLGWKFSIARRNSSTIKVVILEAPINLFPEGLECTYQQHISESSRYVNEIGQEVRNAIFEIANAGNYDNSDAMTDYFDVGFYLIIGIGDWDRPFKVSQKKVNEKHLKDAA